MSKDQTQENTEKTETAVSAKKSPTSKSKKHGFFVGLIFMLLLAVGSGTAVYYTTPVVLSSLAPKKTLTVKTISSAKTQELEVQEPTKIIPEETVALKEEIVFPQEEVTEEEEEENLIEVRSPAIDTQVVQQIQIETPRKKSSYSILKAMELRDAFKNGGECRPLLEELVAMPGKTPDMDQALMELLQSCLDRPIAGQMQEAFHAAKKRAILRIFQTKYPTYIAYLKALPYFLANVRKKNPTGDNPLDILDCIQNAVEADHPQLVLKLIPELPENVQATLNDVTQLAEAESNLHRTLNRLMKALFDEGER